MDRMRVLIDFTIPLSIYLAVVATCCGAYLVILAWLVKELLNEIFELIWMRLKALYELPHMIKFGNDYWEWKRENGRR
jgi:hypothetical protein